MKKLSRITGYNGADLTNRVNNFLRDTPGAIKASDVLTSPNAAGEYEMFFYIDNALSDKEKAELVRPAYLG